MVLVLPQKCGVVRKLEREREGEREGREREREIIEREDEGTRGKREENRSLTVNLPRLGFCFPARILSAVDLPMPLVPTSPSTSPGRGMGSRCSLKELAL